MVIGLAGENAAEGGGYLIKVALDGLTRMKVWIDAPEPPGDVALSVNGAPADCGSAVAEGGGWYACGHVALPRGQHILTVEAAAPVARVLLSPDEGLVMEGRAELAWQNRAPDGCFENREYVYTAESLAGLKRHGFVFDHPRDAQDASVPSGVPLGGIGAGKLELTAHGLLTAFTGNNNQDCPIYRMPGSFFAVQATRGGAHAARLLQTVTIDQQLVPMACADADLVFPEAELSFADGALPLSVRLTAFSPHVPRNAADSSIPCAFFHIELKNSGLAAVDACVLASWESLVNVGGSMQVPNRSERLLPLCYHTWNHSFAWSDRRANRQSVVRDGGTGVLFGAEDDRGNPNSFGAHLLWTPDGESLAVPDRDIVNDEYAFSRWFEKGCAGDFTAAGDGEFRAGALVVRRHLEPNESAGVDFLLCWHMPVLQNAAGHNFSVRYAARYPDVLAVRDDAWGRRQELFAATREVRTLLERSGLPRFLVLRLLNDRFVANTCSWYDGEGAFSINEAPTGMDGCLGTLDQRTASQGYWTTFYPELDAAELDLFRRSQGADGLCSHHIGFASIDLKPTDSLLWPDLAAAYVIQVQRHWMRTGDDAFLRLHWPHVCAAVEWACRFDDGRCGIPWIKQGRGTTYDNQHWEGVNAFIATMHLAALLLGAHMADHCDAAQDAARWRSLAGEAQRTRMKLLWAEGPGGAYLQNAADPSTGRTDDSCFIAPLAGDWAVAAAGLTGPMPRETMRRAAAGAVARCVSDTGLTDQSGRPETPAFMQYPVAYLAAAALYAGDAPSAWRLMRVDDEVLTTPPSTHFIQGLTYHFDGSHTSSLPYYMTAPVSWMFLEAMTGLALHVPEGRLRLAPRPLPGERRLCIPVFTTTSWMNLEYDRSGGGASIRLTPARRFAPCSVLRLEAEAGSPEGAAALIGGQRFEPVGFEDGFVLFDVRFDPGAEEAVISIQNGKDDGSHGNSTEQTGV